MTAILTEKQSIHIMQRQTELKNWLAQCYPNQSFELAFAAADADFRRYFRAVFADGGSVICMDAPPDKMQTAPYVRVQQLFQMLNVPQILHHSPEQGFMVLNDLGDVQYLKAMQHDPSPDAHKALLLEAVDELIVLQQASRAGCLEEYSREILLREMNLFPEWFVGKELGKTLNFAQRRLWQQGTETLLDAIAEQPKVFVHRDFIVRNLMLTRGRPGVLDFQDALYGPITYDLVSLTRDAFIEWDEEFTLDIVIRYWEKARRRIARAGRVRHVLPLVRMDGRSAAFESGRHFRAAVVSRRQRQIPPRNPALFELPASHHPPLHRISTALCPAVGTGGRRRIANGLYVLIFEPKKAACVFQNRSAGCF